MGSEALHEELGKLSEETINMHRALVSLIEELEAVDWYNQRYNVTEDEELKRILAHNRDEEKEHAAMLLEWIRKNDSAFSDELKEYLFKSK
ncbi:MAG: ferritin [candidate division Zixibacteria bacterium]|nr:ferritin [candidate division Zixibacteria bacterium]